MILVTESNLIARINERLRAGRERLFKTPEWRGFPPEGDHYIINVHRDTIVQTHVDIEDLGRELGVLRVGEVVDDGTKWPNTNAVMRVLAVAS